MTGLLYAPLQVWLQPHTGLFESSSLRFLFASRLEIHLVAITTEGLAGNVDSQLRLGVEDESDLSSFALADEIMQWDTISGVLRRSKIPQDLEPSCIVKNSLYFAESLETLEH